MCRRHFLPAALMLLAMPTLASGQAFVWISEGRSIRQITTAGASAGTSQNVHVSGGTAIGHLVHGPDAWLYFAEHFTAQSCISRLNPTGNVSRTTGANVTYAQVLCSSQLLNQPRELRFDSTGALLFATVAQGVRKIARCALTVPATCQPSALPVAAADGAGSGLDQAADGALLFTDGDAIERSPSAPGFPIAVFNPLALDVVTGGEGSALSAQPTGAICVAAGNGVPCFDKAGAPLQALHTFAAIDKPQAVVFDKRDTAWVSTSVDPTQTLTAGTAPHNGLLWRIDGSGATLVYPSRINGPQPPVVGVALPLTSKTVTETTATTTHDFVFGPDVFSIVTPLPCRLAVTVLEQFPSAVQACLDSTGLSLAPATYLGESFPTEYGVTVVAGACFGDEPEATEIITAFFPVGENLSGVRRPDGAPAANNPCVARTLANWALAAPNDAGLKMGSDGTSSFMGARVTGASAATVRLLPPLSNAPLVTTDPTQAQVDAAVVLNRGNIAVKFALTGGGTTPNAVLSVQRLGWLNSLGHLVRDSTLCDVQPQDAVTGPPTFFNTSDHRFNLDTSAMTPVECTQPGLYAFGISFPVDNVAAPVTFLVVVK